MKQTEIAEIVSETASAINLLMLPAPPKRNKITGKRRRNYLRQFRNYKKDQRRRLAKAAATAAIGAARLALVIARPIPISEIQMNRKFERLLWPNGSVPERTGP